MRRRSRNAGLFAPDARFILTNGGRVLRGGILSIPSFTKESVALRSPSDALGEVAMGLRSWFFGDALKESEVGGEHSFGVKSHFR